MSLRAVYHQKEMLVLVALALSARVAAVLAVQCRPGHFQCRQQEMCVALGRRCDGVQDCSLYSEEEDCALCQPGALLCDRTRCVAEVYLCDGHEHCRDGSDELPVTCPPGRRGHDLVDCWRGSPSSRRSALVRCDGIRDCVGGEDEVNCSMGCQRGGFKCSLGEGRCMPAAMLCNGLEDCANGFDETHPNCSLSEHVPAVSTIASSLDASDHRSNIASRTSSSSSTSSTSSTNIEAGSAELTAGSTVLTTTYVVVTIAIFALLGMATAAALWCRKKRPWCIGRGVHSVRDDPYATTTFSTQGQGNTEDHYEAVILPL